MYVRPPNPPPLLQRRWRWSWVSSFGLHVLLLCGILAQLLLVALLAPVPQQARHIVLQAVREAPGAVAVEWRPLDQSNENWLAEDAASIEWVAESLGDSRWELLNETDSAQDHSLASEFLSAQLMKSIDEAEQHSPEDNLERLERLTGQLNAVSSEPSVQELTAQVSKLLGTAGRASEPAKAEVGGEFDFETAQLHDVKREPLDDGSFHYTAVLIDSAGRTMESEMAAAEGESAYKTFELLKSNPLLERVYRGVVMSLLDKVLKPSP